MLLNIALCDITSALHNTFQATKSRENNASTQITSPDQQLQNNHPRIRAINTNSMQELTWGSPLTYDPELHSCNNGGFYSLVPGDHNRHISCRFSAGQDKRCKLVHRLCEWLTEFPWLTSCAVLTPLRMPVARPRSRQNVSTYL